jgi:hypothetical protein
MWEFSRSHSGISGLNHWLQGSTQRGCIAGIKTQWRVAGGETCRDWRNMCCEFKAWRGLVCNSRSSSSSSSSSSTAILPKSYSGFVPLEFHVAGQCHGALTNAHHTLAQCVAVLTWGRQVLQGWAPGCPAAGRLHLHRGRGERQTIQSRGGGRRVCSTGHKREGEQEMCEGHAVALPMLSFHSSLHGTTTAPLTTSDAHVLAKSSW